MFYLTYEDDNHPELNSGWLFFTQKSIMIYTKVLYIIPKCVIIVL